MKMNRHNLITLIGIVIIVVVVAVVLVVGHSVEEPTEPSGLIPNIINYIRSYQ